MCFDENGKIESGVELCDGFKGGTGLSKKLQQGSWKRTGKLSRA